MVLFDKLDKQQSVIQELKEGLIATQKTMVEGQRSTTEMMSCFDQFRRMSQFPTMSPWFSPPPNQNQHNMQGFMHGIGSQKVQNSSKDPDAYLSCTIQFQFIVYFLTFYCKYCSLFKFFK